MATVYDNAFRTVLNDCPKLILPVLNEIFHEHYTGGEEVRFYPNEQIISQQGLQDKKRITDTNFSVQGGAGTSGAMKKYHLECESGRPGGHILIRLFEYDAQIALDDREAAGGTLTVSFPNTAVIYLRARERATGTMRYVINTPGGTVRYDIPIMKVQSYSLDEIFDKRLFFLIPFHIFSHEKRFDEYDRDDGKLVGLRAEYDDILARLDRLERQGDIDAFDKRTIVEVTWKVLQEITKKHENVQKGMGDVMVGEMMETEARAILDQGEDRMRKGMVLAMLREGDLPVERIAKYSGLSIAEIQKLASQSEEP